MTRVLNCEGLGGLSVTVFITKVDENIIVILSNLGKLKLFLPILYITEKKEVFVQWCTVKIIQI